MNDWQRHNDGVYSTVVDGIGLAVFESGGEWFYNTWNNDNPDGLIYDSFDQPGGAYTTAESACEAAVTWYEKWKDSE
jgi:hypothetical protein